MQSFAPQTTSQAVNTDGNSKATSCHPTSSPAKMKHVEVSRVSTGTQKPAFVLVQENGVVKAKQILKVVKVVKPQIPACIKASDATSLLDQFLEYEQKQSSSVMIVKGSSVTLTPVSSPSHTPRFPGHDSGSKQTTISPNGLTPPVSPPSDSKMTLSPTKNLSFTVTPAKNALLSFPSTKTNNDLKASVCLPSKASNQSSIASKCALPKKVTAFASVGKISKLHVTPSKNITPNIVALSPPVNKISKLDVTPSKPPSKFATVSPSVDKTASLPERLSEKTTAKVEKACAMEIDEENLVGGILVDNSNNNEVSIEKKEPAESKELPQCSSHLKSIKESKTQAVKPEELQEPHFSRQVKAVQNYKIPKRKPDDDLKRHICSDDEHGEIKDDDIDFKRKKYARDECYWTTSDEENDDNSGRYHRSKRRKESRHVRRHPRDSSSDSDNESRSRRSYSRQKYENQHDKSKGRSRSPHQTHKEDSDDDRHRKNHSKNYGKHEKKSPLKEDSKESNVHLFDIENERKKNFKLDRTIKETSNEKRKIVYVGNIEDSMSKSDIWSKFRKFGPIEKTTVHYRKDGAGDNYSFVTFVDPSSALDAIEEGKTDPDLKHLDICFGGRRKFCGGSYVDFDSTTSCLEEQQEKEGVRKTSHSNEAVDFDTLLQMALKNKKR